MNRFTLFATVVAMTVASVAHGAADTAPKSAAAPVYEIPSAHTSNGWASGTNAPVPPPAKGAIERLVKSGLASQRVRRESWEITADPPAAEKRRAGEADLESIVSEITAENTVAEPVRPEDTNRRTDDDARTGAGFKDQSAEIWSFTPVSASMNDLDDAVFGPIENPLMDISAFGDLTTNTRWLMSITSNYFQSTKEMAGLTRAGSSGLRARPVKSEATASTGGGSSIPAYITLFLIFLGIASVVASRMRT